MNDYAGIVLRTDLAALVSKAGSKLHRAGAEMRGTCPIHKGNNQNGFAVYRDGTGHQKWKCFSGPCGQGDALDFVQAWLGYDKQVAYEYLGGNQNIDPAELVRLASARAEQAERELQETIRKAQQTLDELRAAKTWLKYHEALDEDETRRELWNRRGIPDVWQDLWQLGFCQSFTIRTDAGLYTTPTLSIPIFDQSTEPLNIRHRLLNPPQPNDKYRPDRPGLKALPFICDPDMSLNTDRVLVLEGEIKSMVTYIEIDDPDLQVIGFPGKCSLREFLPRLKGHHVVFCLDPDAQAEARAAALEVGGYLFNLPDKIDDMILAGILHKGELRQLYKGARRAW